MVAQKGRDLRLKIANGAGFATVAGLLVAGPILVMGAGAILSWSFRLDQPSHKILMSEIDRLRAGATEPSTPEAKSVVESLTGWPFEKLWGRNRLS